MGQAWGGPLEQIDTFRYRIPRSYKPSMRVDGIIYADSRLLPSILSDRAAEQVAQAVLFLASDESAAITGHNLVTDRGVGIQNPAAVQPRTEADIRSLLEAQGSEWIRGEE